MDRKYCNGCADNFYNGNNKLDIKECWCLKTAKLVNRVMIGFWENPPYKNKKAIKKPICFNERGNNRTLYVSPERISLDGYLR